MLPPVPGGLDIDGVRSKFLNSVFGAMGKSVGGIGGPNECECTILLGILEGDEGVLEGIESVGNSVIYIAIDIGISDEPMNNFSCTHLITISSTIVTTPLNQAK